MDNRRVLLAVALSLGVLVFWNIIFPPVQPVQQSVPPVVSETPQKLETLPATSMELGRIQKETASAYQPGRKIQVETPLYTAIFAENGGVLQSFFLKKYKETVKAGSPDINLVPTSASNKAPFGLIWNTDQTWRSGQWTSSGQNIQIQAGEKASLDFATTIGNLTLRRHLVFNGDDYGIKEDVQLTNSSPNSMRGLLSFSLATAGLSAPDDAYNRMHIAYMGKGGRQEEEDIDDLALGFPEKPETVSWAGAGNNYFLVALLPQTQMFARTKYEDNAYRITVGREVLLEAGQHNQLQLSYYLGPKVKQELAKMPNNLTGAIRYGWFDIIAKPLIQFLHFLYGYTQDYGLAIILLTICIKILFWPLSQKSYKSMEQMKKIQPMMSQIREKYKDDREKMNAEMMHLYKTYKINPAGGCLPMLLQIPVFIALYQALLGAIELRHASFIAHIPFTDIAWLTDLSAKDPYYITPIIMGATMFLQQKMSPAPGDPTQAKIMMFLPLIFTFIFLNFPSGLVVYWLVNNILSIFQQWLLTRKNA